MWKLTGLQTMAPHAGHALGTADRLAKEGGLREQQDSYLLPDEKTIIKTLIARKWLREYSHFNKNDSYYCLNKADQIIVFHLQASQPHMKT